MALAPDAVADYLDTHPEFTSDYFLQNATPKLVEKWVMRRSHRGSVPSINRVNKIVQSSTDLLVLKPLQPSSSVASNYKLKQLYGSNEPSMAEKSVRRNKKTAEELMELTEKELFMELIRDIAYELDVDCLCHKILVNVSILTKGDRCSLFLVKGHKERKYLISRLFDVTTESTVEDAVKPEEQAIIIPMGQGIAGHAASTGESINIKDAYKDPRFNQAIDKSTGYRTHTILCMPIKNQDGEVIGVAQIINKKDGEGDQAFSDKDEEVFRNYLTFCGIGLTNAQLFDLSVQEFRRNQVLLSLARNIFEDTEKLETVVRRIMTQAMDLLPCERCTVYVLDNEVTNESEEIEADQDVVFSHVFDLINDNGEEPDINDDSYWESMAKKSCPAQKQVYAAFAMLVVKSGEVLNIDSLSKDTIDSTVSTVGEEDFSVKCMLCSPIYNNNQEIIGVAQLINKYEGHSFDENDEAIFEGFAVFCGLGLHNTQMYEKANLMLAKQKVNMEILSYHAAAPMEDWKRFDNAVVPADDAYSLQKFEFDDFMMTEDETILMSMRMFVDLGLMKNLHIPEKLMWKFLLTVKKNYRPVIYHNWRHAFNVAQSVFTMMTTGNMSSWFTDLELFVLIVACLCHDLDHRGTNNTFQTKTESPIALLYGTSTMEYHHFEQSVMILNCPGCEIFGSLRDDDYKLAIKMLKEAILSTDLALYFKKRAAFTTLVENQQADWTQFENRGILRAMMMTACDVAAITKPWPVQQRVAELVASEFFEQGDMERSQLSAEPIPMMDRQKHHELPKMQVGFIDFVCLPLYKLFYQINPHLKPFYDGVMNNKKNWQNAAENGYEPPKDISFLLPPSDSEPGSSKPRADSLPPRNKKHRVSFKEDKAKSKTCNMM